MITSPVQNLLVADRQAIGLFVTGRVPIRKAGDGSAPVPGDGSHDWVGWATGEQLPHSVSPASGRLVNANEPVSGPDFPVFMGRDGFRDWRARRIRELLGRSERHTAADFAAMQADVVNMFARQVLPDLLALPGVTGREAAALSLLRDWDGSATMDRPQPLIFNAWMSDFYGAVLRHAGAGNGLGAPVSDFVAFVLSPAGAHWCDGDCAPMLRELAGHDGAVAERPLRRRSCRLALGRRASGGVRSPDTAQCALARQLYNNQHPQPRR